MRLEADRTALVVVDAQERLFPHIHEHERLQAELVRLISGFRTLELPIVVTEQYVKGLGPTVTPVVEALGDDYAPLEKIQFSCCGDNQFLERLVELDRSHIVICGIETHVCVYQTAMDLLDRGYYVHVCADAVSSRTPENRELGLTRMVEAGATRTGVEMCLFELLVEAGTDRFKAISKLVR